MATVINTPGDRSDDSGTGVVVGVLIAIVIIVLFFLYGLPAIRNNQAPADNGKLDVNVTLPAGQNNNPAPNQTSPSPTSPTPTTP